MSKRLFLLLLTLCSVGIAYGQERSIAGSENGSTLNVLYRNEASGKIYANTRGFGLLFRRGKHVTANTRSYFEIDAQTLKHPKEVKVTGDAADRKRFVYGKMNSVFLLRGAIGLQNVLFSKADLKAVEIRYSYSLGPTLAFVKPYYVQKTNLFRNELNQKTVPFNEDTFTQDSVIGRGAFVDGLADTKIRPGLTGKFNLSFEYAPYTNLIRAIETGICVDFFPQSIQMMARNPKENVMITLHVGFVFGRKWF